jgi:hypothetical protein
MPGLARFVVLLTIANATGLSYYVSCDKGDDAADGTMDSPFRSLERARNAIRASDRSYAQTASVFIREGVCELTAPLMLTKEDSGVLWSAYQNEKVLLSGAVQLRGDLFEIQQGDGIIQVNLRAQNITQYGALKARGYAGGSACILLDNFEPSALELFYRPADGVNTTVESRMMSLARYPNLEFPVSTKSWTQVASLSGTTIGVSSEVSKRIATNKWASEKDIWTHGVSAYTDFHIYSVLTLYSILHLLYTPYCTHSALHSFGPGTGLILIGQLRASVPRALLLALTTSVGTTP